MTQKYLVSIEVDPYEPNRQNSIINSTGGEPKHHFPTNGSQGVLVVMIRFEDVNKLEHQYNWIKDTHLGYYTLKLER